MVGGRVSQMVGDLGDLKDDEVVDDDLLDLDLLPLLLELLEPPEVPLPDE